MPRSLVAVVTFECQGHLQRDLALDRLYRILQKFGLRLLLLGLASHEPVLQLGFVLVRCSSDHSVDPDNVLIDIPQSPLVVDLPLVPSARVVDRQGPTAVSESTKHVLERVVRVLGFVRYEGGLRQLGVARVQLKAVVDGLSLGLLVKMVRVDPNFDASQVCQGLPRSLLLKPDFRILRCVLQPIVQLEFLSLLLGLAIGLVVLQGGDRAILGPRDLGSRGGVLLCMYR